MRQIGGNSLLVRLDIGISAKHSTCPFCTDTPFLSAMLIEFKASTALHSHPPWLHSAAPKLLESTWSVQNATPSAPLPHWDECPPYTPTQPAGKLGSLFTSARCMEPDPARRQLPRPEQHHRTEFKSFSMTKELNPSRRAAPPLHM